MLSLTLGWKDNNKDLIGEADKLVRKDSKKLTQPNSDPSDKSSYVDCGALARTRLVLSGESIFTVKCREDGRKARRR
jgi:hypothetical protein